MTHPVIELEEKRRLSLGLADVATLKSLCDPAMIYRHGTGVEDNLESYLKKFETKQAIYANVVFENLQVITPASTNEQLAIVMGHMYADITRPSGPAKVKSHFQTTWHHSDGQWKLLAVHSAPLNG